MPDPLPPADITVTSESSSSGDVTIDAVVKREGARERSYRGEGKGVTEAARDLLKRVFDDPSSIEYVRKK